MNSALKARIKHAKKNTVKGKIVAKHTGKLAKYIKRQVG